uniref:HAT C-terminal dimerisation domain-containing protein n=1 Tax=Poecilia formosa TaxID=48698 RepID=A0A087XJB4_POEFO
KKSLFCFMYLLFGGDTAWTQQGIVDLKHLSESSTCHIRISVKLSMLSQVNIACQLDEGHSIAVQRHNELVKKNRHALSQILDCIKFCRAHDLTLRGSDESSSSMNRGVFLDLVNQFYFLDSQLVDHLSSTHVAKCTSKTSQNKLLYCILEVYQQKIKDEILEASFVAVQADETTEVSRGPFKLENKLIAQTYDGAVVMSGTFTGLQVRLQESFPHAHTSFNRRAHRLPQSEYFLQIFRLLSPKRTAVLDKVCNRRIPASGQMRWNFKSHTVHSVFEQEENLNACFATSIKDSMSIQQTHGLYTLLQDKTFLFILSFFHRAFTHVDIHYNILQKCAMNPTKTKQALENFTRSINVLNDSLTQMQVLQHRARSRVKCRNIMIEQSKACFEKAQQLNSFEFINPDLFSDFNTCFPQKQMDTACEYFPMICKEKLKGELMVMYSSTEFEGLTSAPLKMLIDNKLPSTFSETLKSTQIAITNPMTSAESEKYFSTLKKIKSFLRSYMGQERLNALATLFIEQELIQRLPDFNEKVI